MAAIHCSDGPEARHELTSNLDQLTGADQRRGIGLGDKFDEPAIQIH